MTPYPGLSPQCATVLSHLKATGSITPVEAQVVYRIRSLPRRIKDLKAYGYNIVCDLHQDMTGQRYGRYRLAR